ncbi:hypothetical protein SDC9_91462 [bioreactor metagenome]|uniref:Uncharacterized protein n=1 Tax=bioreactor metagenome TaxID=1076179 RepID=A0A644ZUY2_9ZZZZ
MADSLSDIMKFLNSLLFYNISDGLIIVGQSGGCWRSIVIKHNEYLVRESDLLTIHFFKSACDGGGVVVRQHNIRFRKNDAPCWGIENLLGKCFSGHDCIIWFLKFTNI